jgi:hypothetical protein
MEPLKEMSPAQLSSLMLLNGAYRMGMDDVGVAAWAHYLADIDAATLRQIVDAWVSRETRPPSIADIRERLAGLDGSDAEAAWLRVLKLVMHGSFRAADRREKAFGWTGEPRLEHAVKAAGGWINLGLMDDKQTTWAKKEFIQAYGHVAQRLDVQALIGAGVFAVGPGETYPALPEPQINQTVDAAEVMRVTRDALKRGASSDEMERITREAMVGAR